MTGEEDYWSIIDQKSLLLVTSIGARAFLINQFLPYVQSHEGVCVCVTASNGSMKEFEKKGNSV
jgi:hypothetical protein